MIYWPKVGAFARNPAISRAVDFNISRLLAFHTPHSYHQIGTFVEKYCA